MAVDNEVRLISKVVLDRYLDPVTQRGVNQDWFNNPDCKQVWKFVIKHHSAYGEVPTGVTVKENFPTFRLLKVEDSLEYLADQFAAHRRSTSVYRLMQNGVQAVQDPNAYEDVIALLRTGLAELDSDVTSTSDLDITISSPDRYDNYLALKNNPGGLLGVSTSFPTIDEATAGLQGGQLVTIIAPPKCGKSMLLLKIAMHTHERGLKPVFQSFEMSNSEQQQRFDAMKAEISHNRLRRGILTGPEEERYKEMLAELDGKHPFVMTDAVNGTTVSSLAAKVSAHNPDIVFVDGVYLMLDEVTGESNTPQALTNITRSLKRMAQRLDKPVVISTQTLLWKMKGNAVTANSVGYSSSFFQDSDVMLGLERIEDDDDRRRLKIVASRNCGPAEVDLEWDWENGRFNELARVSYSDADTVTDDDSMIEFDTGVA
jgi:replicative DNA helicase